MNIRKKIGPYLYIALAILAVALIVLFPILYTFYISLTNMNLYNWFDYSVIGFGNYKDALFSLNSGFLKALLNTVIWTVVNMALQLVIALIIALLLNHKKFKHKNIYKMILMVPWAIPGYISILLWRTGIFNNEFGLLNQWLAKMNLNPVRWLNSNIGAFLCGTTVNLWLALPFMIMIMDGALQSIDRSYYEVADIESANIFQKIFYITIPLMKPVIGPAVIITTFTTFKQFDILYLLTLEPGNMTGSSFHTIITYAHNNAFITSNYGYSSAISVIIFVILLGFSFLTNKELRRKKV